MCLKSVERATGQHKKSLAWVAAVAAQVGLLALTILVVVIVPSEEEDPEFVAKKTIYLPQRDLEHQAALSEFQQAASSPMAMEQLTTEALLPDMLPAMPALPTKEFNTFDNLNPMADAEALLNESGLLSQLQGLNAGSSNISFLGIEDQATRVVIAFDVSTSVVNNMKAAGLSLERIEEETLKLIEGLNANTLFGLVQFVRAYEKYEDFLIPATTKNKAAAVMWLGKSFGKTRSSRNWERGKPDGIQSVLQACFAMEPDVIFILSDGSFQRTSEAGGSKTVPWKELKHDISGFQKQLREEARIHFIGFGMKEEDSKEAGRLVRLHEGRLKTF